MAFDIKRAESIAYGYKEWIHKGQKTFEQSVKEIKETYREDMAKEIIRILESEIKEVEEKVKWALVFTDVKEAEEARKDLSRHNIYPDSQRENKLLWTDKDDAEYAREHVGGLIESWTVGAIPSASLRIPFLPTHPDRAIPIDYMNFDLKTGEFDYTIKGEKEIRSIVVHAGVFIDGVRVLCEVKGRVSTSKQILGEEGAKFYVEYDNNQVYRVYINRERFI